MKTLIAKAFPYKHKEHMFFCDVCRKTIYSFRYMAYIYNGDVVTSYNNYDFFFVICGNCKNDSDIDDKLRVKYITIFL